MDENNSLNKVQNRFEYRLTLLSREITPEQVDKVSKIMAKHGLVIDLEPSLSQSIPMGIASSPIKQCIQLPAYGDQSIMGQCRVELLKIASQFAVDVCIQEESSYLQERRLAVFDMDSTLIEAEVIDLLAEAAGIGNQVAKITERAMQGELDFNDSFRTRLAMLKGLDERVLAEIAEQLPLTEGAEHLMRTLKSLGYKTAIVSGGFSYFAQHLQCKLGMDYAFANELEIVDGKVTGQVSGEIINGERKAALLTGIAANHGIPLEQVIAVGDGANDLPMLKLAGLGIAFRAKPLVRKQAPFSISQLGLDSILYLLLSQPSKL